MPLPREIPPPERPEDATIALLEGLKSEIESATRNPEKMDAILKQLRERRKELKQAVAANTKKGKRKKKKR